jgi:hypothetical protein
LIGLEHADDWPLPGRKTIALKVSLSENRFPKAD